MTVEGQNTELIDSACHQDRPKTRYDRKNKLKLILEFLYSKRGIKYLPDYDPKDILALFEWIDAKEISLKAKSRYRYHLKTIITYALKQGINDPGIVQKIAFWNFILSKDYFQFKETGEKRKILYISPEEMRSFLQHLRETHIENYILFSILAYSGCRIGGLMDVRFTDINHQSATFITHEKPTRHSSGKNTYYLPTWFIDHIQTYQERIQEETLFHVTTKAIRRRLKGYKPQWWCHLFRHSLRANWAKLGMDQQIAELLLNHAPSTVDAIYLQGLNTNPQFLREQYDKFFPY